MIYDLSPNESFSNNKETFEYNAALAITECIKDTRNCQNKISSTKEMDKMLVFTL